MSIEPHAALTVCIRPHNPKGDKPQTLAEYQTKMMARLGLAKMPPADFLANRENKLMWRNNPGPNWDSAKNAVAGNEKRVKAGRWYFVDQDARRRKVMEALPGNTREIADRVGVSKEVAQCALRDLRKKGAVFGGREGNSTVWHRVQEAAE